VLRPVVTIVRHGETEWSRTGRHTSHTDVDLTPVGEEEARRLGEALAATRFDLVLSSPMRRARRTAELAGLVPFQVVDDLVEWDYGELEGLTSAEIQQRHPGWTVWVGPWPGGEAAAEVTARADRVVSHLLDGAAAASDSARVALVGHGHFSRVLAARWVGADVALGRWLDLDTATWCQLGWYRESRVLRHWNVPGSGLSGR
jgi:probable phosphoglycerate mutase